MHSAFRRLLRDEITIVARTGNNKFGRPEYGGAPVGPFPARIVYDDQLIQDGKGEQVRSAGTITVDHNVIPGDGSAVGFDGKFYEILRAHGPKVGAVVDHLKLWFGPEVDGSQVAP